MLHFIEKLNKAETRMRASKGIEAKVLGMDFIFPLLRQLGVDVAETLSTQEERLNAIEDLLDEESSPVELLEKARDVIILLAGLLDSTMVAAGFFEVTPKGLVNTGKAPAELSNNYIEAASQAVDVIGDIEEEINAAEDDEDDEDLGPDDSEGEPATLLTSPNFRSVDIVLPDEVASAAEPAKLDDAPDTITVDTSSESGAVDTPDAAVAVAPATNTEHDTDAA
jgi:hypothetical protein